MEELKHDIQKQVDRLLDLMIWLNEPPAYIAEVVAIKYLVDMSDVPESNLMAVAAKLTEMCSKRNDFISAKLIPCADDVTIEHTIH